MVAVVTLGETMLCLSRVAVSTLEETQQCSGVSPVAEYPAAILIEKRNFGNEVSYEVSGVSTEVDLPGPSRV